MASTGAVMAMGSILRDRHAPIPSKVTAQLLQVSGSGHPRLLEGPELWPSCGKALSRLGGVMSGSAIIGKVSFLWWSGHCVLDIHRWAPGCWHPADLHESRRLAIALLVMKRCQSPTMDSAQAPMMDDTKR